MSNRLFLNDPSNQGTFTVYNPSMPTGNYDDNTGVAMGDMDGDGHVDLVVTNYCGTCSLYNWQQQHIVWNNGATTGNPFTSYTITLSTKLTDGVALGDVNDDG